MYKYTRKQLIKKWRNTKAISFEHDLLAQKEDSQSPSYSKHCTNKSAISPSCEDRKDHIVETTEKSYKKEYVCSVYPHPKKVPCKYCQELHHPTPSPLEIEEIPEIKRMIVYPDICEDLAKVVKEIVENQNSLISNQKKLYQYIKENL